MLATEQVCPGDVISIRWSDGERALTKITLEDAFGSDDKVVVRWSAVMTHTRDRLGMAATNKKVRITGITIARIEKGKIVQGWDNWDQLALMQQVSSTVAVP